MTNGQETVTESQQPRQPCLSALGGSPLSHWSLPLMSFVVQSWEEQDTVFPPCVRRLCLSHQSYPLCRSFYQDRKTDDSLFLGLCRQVCCFLCTQLSLWVWEEEGRPGRGRNSNVMRVSSSSHSSLGYVGRSEIHAVGTQPPAAPFSLIQCRPLTAHASRSKDSCTPHLNVHK